MGLQRIRRLPRRLLRLFQGRDPNPLPTRDIASESERSFSTLELFSTKEYLAINSARLAHLESLGLPLRERTVLDVGSGPGDLARFFVDKGCDVVCVDGRPENIDGLHTLYPDLRAFVADVDGQPLDDFGTFDVVFCYGLLYHLENPVASLRNMAAVCKELLLVETVICDYDAPILRLVDEELVSTQAIRGLGSRPSPSFVGIALNRIGFPYVYMPTDQPDHPDFQFCWRNDLAVQRDGHQLRSVFVASRQKLSNPKLTNMFAN